MDSSASAAASASKASLTLNTTSRLMYSTSDAEPASSSARRLRPPSPPPVDRIDRIDRRNTSSATDSSPYDPPSRLSDHATARRIRSCAFTDLASSTPMPPPLSASDALTSAGALAPPALVGDSTRTIAAFNPDGSKPSPGSDPSPESESSPGHVTATTRTVPSVASGIDVAGGVAGDESGDAAARNRRRVIPRAASASSSSPRESQSGVGARSGSATSRTDTNTVAPVAASSDGSTANSSDAGATTVLLVLLVSSLSSLSLSFTTSTRLADSPGETSAKFGAFAAVRIAYVTVRLGAKPGAHVHATSTALERNEIGSPANLQTFAAKPASSSSSSPPSSSPVAALVALVTYPSPSSHPATTSSGSGGGGDATGGGGGGDDDAGGGDGGISPGAYPKTSRFAHRTLRLPPAFTPSASTRIVLASTPAPSKGMDGSYPASFGFNFGARQLCVTGSPGSDPPVDRTTGSSRPTSRPVPPVTPVAPSTARVTYPGSFTSFTATSRRP
mmetsp:Transcript_9453/g.38287  ORF Transcript_9453/g.38287 Transcript_9453/m.38287 type:complete len:504 (-) Transcript_9453:658-2169(-)